MALRLGPAPNFPQTTVDIRASLDSLQRALFQEAIDLRTRVMQTLPKDGTERMEAPAPLVIHSTVNLPDPTLWEGGLVFDTTTNQIKYSDGANWIALVPFPLPVPVNPAFSAHKNGTNQTGVLSGTDTQVTFGTELYDRGPHFASNVWTPPAGLVTLKAQVFASGALVAQNARISITKNGATTRFRSAFGFSATANSGLDIALSDVANGTDAYGVVVNIATSAGNVTIEGAAENTWFTGEWIST